MRKYKLIVLTLTFIGFFFSTTYSAFADGCISGDCANGYGTYVWDNGNKYVGENKDNLAHGQGTLTFGSGDKYVGEFKGDNFNGQGTLTYTNGNKYVGEFKDMDFNGQGTFTFGEGSEWYGDKYVGGFKIGERHGQGTYSYADGTTERGIWKNNELETVSYSDELETASNSSEIVYKKLTLSGMATEREVAILNAVSKGICKVNNIGNDTNGNCKKENYNRVKISYPIPLAESNGGYRNIEILDEGKDFLGQPTVKINVEIAVWSQEAIAMQSGQLSSFIGVDLAAASNENSANMGAALEMQNSTMFEFLKGSVDFNKALIIILDAYGLKNESNKLRAQQVFLETADINSSSFSSNIKEVSILHNNSVEIITAKINSGTKLDAQAKQKLSTAYPPFYAGLAKTTGAVLLGIQTFSNIKEGGDGLSMIANLVSLAFIVNEVSSALPNMIKCSNLLMQYGKENNLEIPDSIKKQQKDINDLGFV